MEGGCFVLAAGLVQHRDDLFDGLERCGGDSAARELLEAIPDGALNKGGSLIAAPDASVVAQAGEGEEILHARLDLDEIGEGLASLDTDGHYSRPDVRSEEHTSELQSLMRISYAVFCLKKKKKTQISSM